jgi:hypothetical protein
VILTPAQFTAIVTTDVAASDLIEVILREEAAIIARYGAHYVAATTITETTDGGMKSVYLKRRIGSVSSITEATTLGGTATTLAASAYYVWPGQGRITRLPDGTAWGRVVTIAYIPADDTDLRRQVLIELTRLAPEQTAMQSESVTGEYSYTAPDWEKTRKRLYKRLEFPTI